MRRRKREWSIDHFIAVAVATKESNSWNQNSNPQPQPQRSSTLIFVTCIVAIVVVVVVAIITYAIDGDYLSLAVVNGFINKFFVFVYRQLTTLQMINDSKK
jgi:hypothetical protein